MRWLLFLLDAEKAHRLVVVLIRFGIWIRRIFRVEPLRIVSGVSRSSEAAPGPVVFGMEFISRVGLAAGFDKDAEIVEGLPALGFGFAEIGTVTPRPQPGNERPRLFRDPGRQAIFNRMGFNGLGASVVSARLAESRSRLPEKFRVGVNLGKNKDTPLEDAAKDYVEAARAFDGLADYLVINVSSPNTPGLRALQAVENLKPIVIEMKHLIGGWKRSPPLLLKLAPEISGSDLAEVLPAAESWGIDGWVMTNTLGGTIELKRSVAGSETVLSGGWSGGLLIQRSRESLIECLRISRLPVVSVGGIMNADEAAARIAAGASLVQLYTGWVYGGPLFPVLVSRRISGR